MAVTVNAPLAAPINLAATPKSGGSLDASTTYHWVVCAADANHHGTPVRRSPPSVEGSFLTTAVNRQADLTWDAVTGATHYNVYWTKSSGDYSGAPSWNGSPRLSASSNGASASTNSITMSSELMKNCLDTFVWKDTYPTKTLPGKLDGDLGALTINFTGTTTLDDIASQIDADGYGDYYYYDGSYFVLKGSIYVTGSTSGSMTLLYKELIFIQGMLKVDNTNCVITLGAYDLDANTSYGSCYVKQLNWGQRMLESAQIKSYRTLYAYNSHYELESYSVLWWNMGGPVASDLDNSSQNIYTSAVDSLNSPSPGSNLVRSYYRARGSGIYKDFTIYDSYFMQSNDVPTTLRNIVIYIGSGASECHIHDDGGTPILTIDIIDCSFYVGTTLNSPNVPYVNWNNVNQTYDISFSLTLNVQDELGNAINGAQVSVEDVDGNSLMSVSTDANGDAAKTDLKCYSLTNSGGSGARNTARTDHVPLTMTITKSGFQTYRKIWTPGGQMGTAEQPWVIRLRLVDNRFDQLAT